MPEGHTLHRLARDLNAAFRGRPVAATSPQGRFADGAALIDGRELQRAEAYGKHLFLRFDGVADVVHVHLGLYGSFVGHALPAPEPKGALRLRLRNDEVYRDLRGPTVCELLAPADVEALFARLGPDPLRRGADPDRAWRRLSRSRAPMGTLLMDQSVLAGVGNVYRAELLFRHRVDPFLAGQRLGEQRWEAMWADLVALMRAGVRSGRIVTTAPADRDRPRGRPTREDSFYVYRRAGLPCRICGTPVSLQVLATRNLFWCAHCQREAG